MTWWQNEENLPAIFSMGAAENDRRHDDLCVGSVGIRPMDQQRTKVASKHEMHRKTAVCIEGCGEHAGE